MSVTDDTEAYDLHLQRKELICIGDWGIYKFVHLNCAYIYHTCGYKRQQPYMVSYKYICGVCNTPVPDEIQALYLLMEDGIGFIDKS